MTASSIAIWNPTDVVAIPSTAESPQEIVEFGHATLSKRDMHAIVSGFEAGGFEMVSTFIWTKAAATLKKQVATLGMEFVGEMLRRPDLNEDSDPATSISDYEAISLAEDLGMITATQGLRLKQAMQLVNHFANLDQIQAEDEQMHREDAISILRTCITSILGKAHFDAAIQFADFRKSLSDRTLKATDGDVTAVSGSPYFFVRTTLSVLMALLKNAQGAKLEHAVGNTMLLVPTFWPRLRDPEKWQIGQAYAELVSAGNRLPIAGLKKALLDVRGFDYVPESLRSNTFTEAAARVLSAHFSFNNFFNEAEPMSMLANLGTAIPMPAFPKCMEATLAVHLGNRYGHAFAAQQDAERILKALRPAQWEYYVNQCLPSDRTVLDKLCDEEKPIRRWKLLTQRLVELDLSFRTKSIAELMKASMDSAAKPGTVATSARKIRESITTS